VGDQLGNGKASFMAITSAVLAVTVVLSAREVSVSGTSAGAPSIRVLHFPKDQSLGVLSTEDPTAQSEYRQHNPDPSLRWGLNPQLVNLETSWQSVGVARGDVTVPSDRDIALRIMLKARPAEMTSPNLRDRCFSDPEDLTGLSRLDPNDLGMLFVSSLGERTYADERVVKPLTRLTGLKMLRLYRTGMTDKGVEHLRSLSSLRSLELTESRVGDAGIAVLKNLPTLEYLDLWTAATGAGLKQLGQSPRLRWMRIRMGRIGAPPLAELASLPRLEHLCLWGTTGLTDQHIKYLEGLTHLKSLTLWGVQDPGLTDASLASIGKLTSLEELYFVRTAARFTSAGVAHLKGLKNLKKVDFGQAIISDDSVRELVSMPGLRVINGGLPLTADSAKTFVQFRDLKSLDVGLKDQTTPGAVSSLFALASLEELRFTGSAVGVSLSDKNVAGIKSLGRLKRLLLWSDNLTDRCVPSIGKLTQLESLDLGADVTKRGLNQLNALTHLQTLAVMPRLGDSGVIDEIPLNLSALADLRTLSLRGFPLRDQDLASLAGMRHLEWLVLEGTFTESALLHLRSLSELYLLDVTGISCSDGEALASLGGLTKLTDLQLSGRITDAALARLPALPSLWSLRIVTDEPIRPETIAHLQQTLPVIEYIHIDKPLQTNPPFIPSTPAPPGRGPANPPMRRTPGRLR